MDSVDPEAMKALKDDGIRLYGEEKAKIQAMLKSIIDEKKVIWQAAKDAAEKDGAGGSAGDGK